MSAAASFALLSEKTFTLMLALVATTWWSQKAGKVSASPGLSVI